MNLAIVPSVATSYGSIDESPIEDLVTNGDRGNGEYDYRKLIQWILIIIPTAMAIAFLVLIRSKVTVVAPGLFALIIIADILSILTGVASGLNYDFVMSCGSRKHLRSMHIFISLLPFYGILILCSILMEIQSVAWNILAMLPIPISAILYITIGFLVYCRKQFSSSK